MFKRALLVLLALGLPLALAGMDRTAVAAGGDVDVSGADWEGLPDKDAVSGRFLIVSGEANDAIPEPKRLVVSLAFPQAAGDVDVAVFDGDVKNVWDQRDNLPPVSPAFGVARPYDTRYRLYADPQTLLASDLVDGMEVADVPLRDVKATEAPFAGTDAAWCRLYQSTGDAAALNEDVDLYIYTLVVDLMPGPGQTDLSEFEVNGFKIAFKGDYLLNRDALLGFMGGAIDQRVIGGVVQTLDPWPTDGDTNTYAGDWSFRFSSEAVCEDLVFSEADADWNAPIPAGTTDQTPTGEPPDDGGRYERTDTGTIIDATSLMIPLTGADVTAGRHGLVWDFLAPDGSVPFISDDATLGHPSENAARQVAQTGKPFQETSLPQSAFEPAARQGIWLLRWRGVDARNAIWIKGLPGPVAEPCTVEGRLFCDDGDGEWEPGVDTGCAGVTLTIQAPDLSTFQVVTEAEGVWSFDGDPEPGTYQIIALDLNPEADCPCAFFVPSVTLPLSFVVDRCDCIEAPILLPGMCPCDGAIAGRVYCDNNEDGVFGGGTGCEDRALEGVTVELRLVGATTALQTTTTNAAGMYMFSSVTAGQYDVVVDPANPLNVSILQLTVPSDPATDPQKRTVDVEPEKTTQDVDFLRCCVGCVEGRVYCDNDDNEAYDGGPTAGGVDRPLADVDLTLTKEGETTAFATTTTAADGTYEFTCVPVGSYTVAVVTTTLPSGVTALDPESTDVRPPACGDCVRADFRYECPGSLSGNVYRNRFGDPNCDDTYEPGIGEEPIPGVDVDLYRTDVDPDEFIGTDTTDGLGFYEFTNLEPGTYRVEVNEAQDGVKRLQYFDSPNPAVLSPVVVEPDETNTGNDFFFCPGEIRIRVYKKAQGDACENRIGPNDTPIRGVTVRLEGENADGTSLTPGPFFAVTDLDGIEGTADDGVAVFTGVPIDLDADTYTAFVDGTQLALTGLTPASGAVNPDDDTTVPGIQLPQGELRVADSVWCQVLCSISGVVRRQAEGCDCDEEWSNRGPLVGVTVELEKLDAPDMGQTWTTATTAPDGGFVFPDLVSGTYEVRVLDGSTVLRYMTPTTPESFEVTLDCPTDEEVVFEYGTASKTVDVVLDIDCGGTPDGGIAGVTVTLEKLDSPDLGLTFDGVTDPAGRVKFPTPAMNALPPGLWEVRVPPQPGLEPKQPLVDTVLLAVCECETNVFEFCGLCTISGHVYKEVCVCDAQWQPGEMGIDGVEVVLTGIDPARAPRSVITSGGGSYTFLRVERGLYLLTVPGTEPFLADLTGPTPTQIQVSCVPPDDVMDQDFFFCEERDAGVFGYVFREPLQDCDGAFGPADTGLDGIEVTLDKSPPGLAFPMTTTTSGGGFYEFTDLEPNADYTVSVNGSDPVLVDLSATTATTVGPFLLECDENRQVDFGFAPQGLEGYVFLETAEACGASGQPLPEGCDGEFNPPQDVGLQNVIVEFVKLDDPQQGLTDTAVTNADGYYVFPDPLLPDGSIPAGLYEVRVVGGVPVEFVPSSPVIVEASVPVCDVGRADFGYCQLAEKCKISGTVYLNEDDACDDDYDEGVDDPIGLVTVILERLSAPAADPFMTTTTDAVTGFYEFEEVCAGDYRIYILQGQSVLASYRAQFPADEQRFVTCEGGEEIPDQDFGYCKDCEEDCCCGDLHKVCVETKVRICEWEEWLDVYVTFYDGCKLPAREIDFAGLWYKGAFPGPETGYNNVITIENVRRDGEWVYVRLCLTAQGCWFPRGFFGKKCRTIEVIVNGRKSLGKTTFRCECVRPGSWFTWGADCGFPEDCAGDPTIGWDDRPADCRARYLVLHTLSWENWVNCVIEKPECKEQSETCRCGYNLVELELDYWVKRGDHHDFYLKLKKWGYDTFDGAHVGFTGHEWHGEKKGWGGYVTVLKIWRVEKKRYYDLWRARLRLRACDRCDGNPRALPEQIDICTQLDSWEHDFWLDLDTSGGEYCLEVGPRLWKGDPIGVNILRWLSVEDAAWCSPYPCDDEDACKGCKGWCKSCPAFETDCPPCIECDGTKGGGVATAECACGKD